MKPINLFAATLLLVTSGVLSGHEQYKGTCPSGSDEYSVTVGGRPVTVYTAYSQFDGNIYFFAGCDIRKKSKVVVRSSDDLSDAVVLPDRYGIKLKHRRSSEIVFTGKPGQKLTIEKDGREAVLHLFLDSPSEMPVDNGKLVYVGPGVHETPEVLELSSGQTLYLAEGAVFKGAVLAKGDDITITGRGIISGDKYEKYKGPGSFPIHGVGCKNLTISGVTVAEPWSWSVVMTECDGVLVDGIKVLASNILNGDAIDICNSSNVTVRNCFLRSQDDIFAIKGTQYRRHLPCSNILSEDCQVWCDRANVYRIGYECSSDVMSGITGRRIDVIHYSFKYRPPEDAWSNTIFWIQPSNGMEIKDCCFEDFRINADGNRIILVEAKSCFTRDGSVPKGELYPETGSASNISFKDMTVTGNPEGFDGEIYILGKDSQHAIKKIEFDNVNCFGKTVIERASFSSEGEVVSSSLQDRR